MGLSYNGKLIAVELYPDYTCIYNSCLISYSALEAQFVLNIHHTHTAGDSEDLIFQHADWKVWKVQYLIPQEPSVTSSDFTNLPIWKALGSVFHFICLYNTGSY